MAAPLMQQSTSLALYDALLILLDVTAAVANPAAVPDKDLELAYTTVYNSISSIPKPPMRDWFKVRQEIAQCLAIILFPTTLSTLLTYRQALALQTPIDAFTQGTFYCWVDVLLAELVSSVLYNPVSTSGTQTTCPSLERRLHEERISLASCLPSTWESVLAVLSHPHSSPSLRRFVISMLYFQLCLVPEPASCEPIATIPTLKSLQCHVEYLSNREWTTNDLRDAAFTIDLFCTLDLRLVRRTESPRSLFQPHTHSNILTLLCRLVEEQHPVANYILFDSNAVIAWLVSIWNQLEVSTLHQKAAVSLVTAWLVSAGENKRDVSQLFEDAGDPGLHFKALVAVLKGVDTKISASVLLCVLTKCFQQIWTPLSRVSHEKEVSQRLVQLAFSNTEDGQSSWEARIATLEYIATVNPGFRPIQPMSESTTKRSPSSHLSTAVQRGIEYAERVTPSTLVLSTIQRAKVSLDFLFFACRLPEVVSTHKTRLECLVNHLLHFLYSNENEHPEEGWNLIAEGTLLLLSTLERSRAPEHSKGTLQKSWIDLEDVLFVIERTTSLEVLAAAVQCVRGYTIAGQGAVLSSVASIAIFSRSSEALLAILHGHYHGQEPIACVLAGDLSSLLCVILRGVHPDLLATIALSPWIPVLIRALKGAQEGQLQPGLVSECRAVLASRIAKYGTRLTSQLEHLARTGQKLLDDREFPNVQTRVYRAGLHMIEISDE